MNRLIYQILYLTNHSVFIIVLQNNTFTSFSYQAKRHFRIFFSYWHAHGSLVLTHNFFAVAPNSLGGISFVQERKMRLLKAKEWLPLRGDGLD